jgi:hypothetical protein
MDVTLFVAFASFAAMIGAWIMLPTTGVKATTAEAPTASTTPAASPSKA